MKNKKSLLSVLLAAVLLCACVAGMLIFGADANQNEVVYTIRPTSGADDGSVTDTETGNRVFKTIKGATAFAAVQEWTSENTLKIELDASKVTTTKDSNLIFENAASSMIVRSDGSLLPITVTKSATQTSSELLIDAGGILIFANHYTFQDLALTFNAEVDLYIVQHVEFKNVTLTGALTGSTVRTTGNTLGAYALKADNITGRLDENFDITAEVIFSGNTSVCATFEKMYALGSVTRVWQEVDQFPESATYGDVTLTHSDFNGRIVIKDSAQIPSKIYGKGEDSPLGSAEVIVEGGKVDGAIYGVASSVVKTGEKTNVIFKGGELAGGAYAIAGTATVESGAEAAITLDGGVTTTTFRINEENSYSVEEGGTLAAYLNSGTLSGSGVELLGAGGSTIVSGMKDNSKAVVELNGAIIGQTTGTTNFFFYPFQNATFNCDIYFTITSLQNSNEKAYFRWINKVVVNGDVYTTIDTTEDGWKTDLDGNRAEDDSDNNKSEAIVNFSGHIGDWSGTFNGNSYTRINGGDDPDSIYVKYFYSINGTNIYNEVENSSYYYFGLVRNAQSGGLKVVDTKLTNVTASNVYCSGSYYAKLNPATSLSTKLTNCKVTGTVFVDSENTTVQANVTVEGDATKIAKIASKDKTDVNSNIVIKGGTFSSTVTGTSVTIHNGTFNGNITATDLSIYSATIGNPVSATNSLTLEGGTIVNNFTKDELAAGSGNIVATAVNGDTTIKKGGDGMFRDGNLVLTYPKTAADKIHVEYNVRGYAVPVDNGNETYTLTWYLVPISAQLVLEERVYTRILMKQSDVEEAIRYRPGTYVWSGFGKKEIAFVPAELPTCEYAGVTYYYFEFDAVGADKFDVETSKYFTSTISNGAEKLSITNVATDGINLYGAESAEGKLFQALIDYGKSTQYDPENAETAMREGFYVSQDWSDYAANHTFNKAERTTTTPIEFTNITLLMGDTIGIRLKTAFTAVKDLEDALSGCSFTVNGRDMKGEFKDYYAVSMDDAGANACIDLYVNADDYDATMVIEVKAGEEILLKMSNSVAGILNALNPDAGDNVRLQATAMLMVAAHNYKAAQAA